MHLRCGVLRRGTGDNVMDTVVSPDSCINPRRYSHAADTELCRLTPTPILV